jgi:hypothetical protein
MKVVNILTLQIREQMLIDLLLIKSWLFGMLNPTTHRLPKDLFCFMHNHEEESKG